MFRIYTKPSLYRDFSLLSGLIFLIVMMVCLWVIYKTFQNQSEAILRQLEGEAVRIDRALIIEIERSSYLLESIGRQIDVEGGVNTANILKLLKTFSRASHVENSEFFWIDANQQLSLSSRKGRLASPIDVADRDYMKRAITTPWEIHIGQPIQGRVSDRWIMPIAMGLTDAEGRFKGAVAIGIDIDTLSHDISEVTRNPHIHTSITNLAFTVLTEMGDEKDFFARHFNLKRLTRHDFNEQHSSVYSRASLWDSQTIDSYFEKSSNYPYIIFTGYDRAQQNKDMLRVLLPRLIQIFIITLFLVLTLWTVRKRIIKPVILLREHTAELLKGHRFEHNFSKDPTEIEALAHEIERMGLYIEEKRRIEHELVLKNAELLKISESAERTNHLKARFFEQVASSLMSPAKALQEYADSMKKELFGSLGNPKYREMAEAMHSEVVQLGHILQDILSLSQAEKGLLALNESPADLAFIIKKSVRLAREKSSLAVPEVQFDIENDLPKISLDERRIKQMIITMIHAIAKEMNQHDDLTLRCMFIVGEVHLEFIYRPATAFRTYSPSPANTSLAVSSQTLGLALCGLIIELHDGSLTTKVLSDQRLKRVVIFPRHKIIHR